MNGAIKTSCKYTDIISSTVTGSFARRHDVDPATVYEEHRSSALMSEVSRASVATGFALLPIQAKAVSRIVYRPSSTVYLTPVSFDSSPSTYRTPESDVMSPVILDMPTGTGKTITSLVGAILFAIERREDMKKSLSFLRPLLVSSTSPGAWGGILCRCYPTRASASCSPLATSYSTGSTTVR